MLRFYTKNFISGRAPSISFSHNQLSASRCKTTASTEAASTLQVPAGERLKPVAKGSLDFTDHRRAFKDKSPWELSRALLVLGVCSYQSFSVRSLKIFNLMERCLGKTITAALVKPLFYNQFVGGVTVPQIVYNIDRMSKAGSGCFILMVLEAIEESKEALPNYHKIIQMMDGITSDKSHLGDKYMQIRISALFTMDLLTELSLLDLEDRERFIHSAAEYMKTKDSGEFHWLIGEVSSNSRITELMAALELLEDIGQKSLDRNIVMMTDAEYTYINPALTALSLALALRCNTNKPMIWNTIQFYLKASFDAIKWELEFAKKNKIHYGVKVVRGAYMTPEGEAARKGGYPTPIHDSQEDTDRCYDEVVEWLLNRIQSKYNGEREIRFVLASHNQSSISTATRKMNEMKINTEDKAVIFAQIYGACDHITYTLTSLGYDVYKSMPAGSVSESLPYLSRRAQENTSVVINSRQERQLLRSEILCRLKLNRYHP